VDGTPFGRYRLVELLGRGSMGEVWRAYDTATNNRTVAIKLPLPQLVAKRQNTLLAPKAGIPAYQSRIQPGPGADPQATRPIQCAETLQIWTPQLTRR
jgi:serine/threonine protein kinase